MGLSLQDQLLKAGLADKKQAGKAKKAKHQKRVNKKQGNAPAPEVNTTRQEQLKKEQESRERNRQLNQEKQQQAKTAQIKQLILDNRLDLKKCDSPFYFKVGTKIKKLYVNPEISDKLSRGALAIVHFNADFEVVPAKTARQIAQRDETVIAAFYEKETEE